MLYHCQGTALAALGVRINPARFDLPLHQVQISPSVKSKESMQLRSIIILLALIVFVGFLGFQFELAVPGTPPSINNTHTPLTQFAPQEIGSYDVLGYAVDKEEAQKLLQTKSGRKQLSPENGAVAVMEELIS